MNAIFPLCVYLTKSSTAWAMARNTIGRGITRGQQSASLRALVGLPSTQNTLASARPFVLDLRLLSNQNSLGWMPSLPVCPSDQIKHSMGFSSEHALTENKFLSRSPLPVLS
mmetsp:Transcript_13383/g.23026  ORF Transcript_13383/g.23026 Transcript_13383/m.23026 type:complete len:112 (-) Transcript_13383:152-487(-)